MAAIRRNRTITTPFDDLADPNVYKAHANLWAACANELLSFQGKTFVFDDHNKPIIRGLLYYFNQCPLAETEDALQRRDEFGELVLDKNKHTIPMFQLNRNIILTGGVGVGKTLIMHTFALYLRRTNNPLAFRNVSVTELLNTYKQHDSIDAFTYNCGRDSFDGNPAAICLHDVGLQTQKFYGNDLQMVIDEYFHARNEIWTQYGVRSYITTNLSKKQLGSVFDDQFGRLNDRWKTYNTIFLDGDSRR